MRRQGCAQVQSQETLTAKRVCVSFCLFNRERRHHHTYHKLDLTVCDLQLWLLNAQASKKCPSQMADTWWCISARCSAVSAVSLAQHLETWQPWILTHQYCAQIGCGCHQGTQSRMIPAASSHAVAARGTSGEVSWACMRLVQPGDSASNRATWNSGVSMISRHKSSSMT